MTSTFMSYILKTPIYNVNQLNNIVSHAYETYNLIIKKLNEEYGLEIKKDETGIYNINESINNIHIISDFPLERIYISKEYYLYFDYDLWSRYKIYFGFTYNDNNIFDTNKWYKMSSEERKLRLDHFNYILTDLYSNHTFKEMNNISIFQIIDFIEKLHLTKDINISDNDLTNITLLFSQNNNFNNIWDVELYQMILSRTLLQKYIITNIGKCDAYIRHANHVIEMKNI